MPIDIKSAEDALVRNNFMLLKLRGSVLQYQLYITDYMGEVMPSLPYKIRSYVGIEFGERLNGRISCMSITATLGDGSLDVELFWKEGGYEYINKIGGDEGDVMGYVASAIVTSGNAVRRELLRKYMPKMGRGDGTPSETEEEEPQSVIEDQIEAYLLKKGLARKDERGKLVWASPYYRTIQLGAYEI